MSIDTDIAKSLRDAHRCWELFQSALLVFQANCQRGDFDAAEAEREKMKTALDDYLDHFAAANMRAEHGRRAETSRDGEEKR